MNAGINQPFSLPTAHTNPTITVKQGEPGLVTEDTVSPVLEGPGSMPPSPHSATSPVIQSEPGTPGWTAGAISSSQESPPNGPGRQASSKSADHLNLQTGRGEEPVCPDHSEQLTILSSRSHLAPTPALPLIGSSRTPVATQNFAHTTLCHTQHPGHFSLRMALT